MRTWTGIRPPSEPSELGRQGSLAAQLTDTALKSVALSEGANVNVEETWLHYRTVDEKRKTYMWCLVNKKACIVIFFYTDTEDKDGNQKHGGRSRNVLSDFIGEAKLKSLQSDGYNVYTYLDDELVDIDHLCCMAHARAKFKYAYDQGCESARFFLEMIGKLYSLEDENKRDQLSCDEIYKRRNNAKTEEVIEKLKNRLYDLLPNKSEISSDLMLRALNYLHTFWEQILAYRNDGEYSIDNMATERTIRPITVQRKNSMFFSNIKGVRNLAVFNTFIETYKQLDVSFRDYFCRLIQELKKEERTTKIFFR